mgnify:CR=1 FL=1
MFLLLIEKMKCVNKQKLASLKQSALFNAGENACA